MASAPSTRVKSALTWAVPLVALAVLAVTLGGEPSSGVVVVVAATLAASVIAAVHHAEVIAERFGEPYGSLVLAIAVTVIEVGLIVTLMASNPSGTETLARDTVFAAVMITCNGVVGLSLVIGSLRKGLAEFNAEGTATAVATVLTLATLSLVLPRFTTSKAGPEFTRGQLVFAGIASIALYALFLVVQTVRHREMFLPAAASVSDVDPNHKQSTRTTLISGALLVCALIGVVGLAKVASGAIEDAVTAIGAPLSSVGVAIALLVLAPETLAAVRNARRERVQASFNLAYGSAIASIGLTIPSIAVASIWLDGRLLLGLDPTQMVLLTITAIVSALTVLPGRATLMEGGVHLALFAAFLFLAVSP
jgi:Ca2+:H+ antiporter